MASPKFHLPSDLHVEGFWKLPETEWKSITKFDLRFVVNKLVASKDQAHKAYLDDVKKMQAVSKKPSRRYQTLEACLNELQTISRNHANKYFWETQAKHVLEIATTQAVNQEQLIQLEQETAITVLKSFNKRQKENNMEPNKKARSMPVREPNPEPIPNPQPLTEPELLRETCIATCPKFKELFAKFKQKAMEEGTQGEGLCTESHGFELMALQNVILLKPYEFSRSMRDHFGVDYLHDLSESITSTIHASSSVFDPNMATELQSTVYNYVNAVEKKETRKGATMKCCQKLVAMSVDRPPAEMQILFGLSKLIQKLPYRTMLPNTNMGETELFTATFDPLLSALLTDPERDVFLRWSNVIPTEGSPSPILQIRPDAIICSIDQRTWGRSLGFGEVKLAEATPNLNALGQDLTRLGALTKRIARCSNPALCFPNPWLSHGSLYM